MDSDKKTGKLRQAFKKIKIRAGTTGKAKVGGFYPPPPTIQTQPVQVQEDPSTDAEVASFTQ